MVTFMICLIGKDEVLNPEKASDGKPSAVAAKNLIKEQSEALMISLLKKESARGRAVGAIPDECRETDLKRTTELICDLLDALTKLDSITQVSLFKSLGSSLTSLKGCGSQPRGKFSPFGSCATLERPSVAISVPSLLSTTKAGIPLTPKASERKLFSERFS